MPRFFRLLRHDAAAFVMPGAVDDYCSCLPLLPLDADVSAVHITIFCCRWLMPLAALLIDTPFFATDFRHMAACPLMPTLSC